MQWLDEESEAPDRGWKQVIDVSDDAEAEPPPGERAVEAALLAAIVESSDDAIVSKNLNGIITSWNASAERIFGYTADEAIGQHISILIPAERLYEEADIIARIKAGERISHFDTVRRHKDGTLIPISLTVSPVRDHTDRIVGASKVARDISDRRRFEDVQRQLSRELNHRSKNLLAIVQSIIRHTIASSPPQEFLLRINERLQALSANQDLLVENFWRGADLAVLLAAQLRQVPGLPLERVETAGEPLFLTPGAAQTLGIAFHELATNALRFGALSAPGGTVAVSWRLEGAPGEEVLHVVWNESGGPRIGTPGHPGFGSAIIRRITGQSMGGDVRTTFEPGGLRWELRAPGRGVVAPRGGQPPVVPLP